MRSQVAAFKAPLHSPGCEPELGDLRFRTLMSEADWMALRWASTGALAVTHAELGGGRFLFRLDIVHPRLGRLIGQTAAFQEAQP